QLYTADDKRRDAGFSLFYMGINLGAFLSPFVCVYLGQEVGWHCGFGAAGVGVTLGLVQYLFGRSRLGHARALRGEPENAVRLWAVVCHANGCTTAVLYLLWGWRDLVLLFGPGGVVLWSRGQGKDPQERKRIWPVNPFCILGTSFWAGCDQAGSSHTLFAAR